MDKSKVFEIVDKAKVAVTESEVLKGDVAVPEESHPPLLDP